MRKILLLIAVPVFFFSCKSEKDESWYRDTLYARKIMNMEFADPEYSPLPPGAVGSFKGLDFFPISKKYVVEARFEKNPDPEPVVLSTNTGRKPVYIKYGTVYFTLDGKDCSLVLYRDTEISGDPEYSDVLFIPFTDLTTGQESYGGGRYLDIKIPGSDKVILNFNKCYNPYCAYDDRWSCVIPPGENDLPVAVYAGVKAYGEGH